MATLTSNGINHSNLLVDVDFKDRNTADDSKNNMMMTTEQEKVELKEVPVTTETKENVPETLTTENEKPADVKKDETKSKTASLTRFFQRDRSKSADKKAKKEKGDAAEQEKLVEGAQTEEVPVEVKEATMVASEQPKKEERHVVKKPQWFQKKPKAPKTANSETMADHPEVIPKPPRQPIGANMTIGLNMLDRDEKGINEHVKLQFEDIFAEPEGYHSVDCVWRLVFILFTRTSACFYKFLALVCAIPLAILWALFFALLTCCNIWCCLPTGKALGIVCTWPLKAWRFIIRGCLDPCFRSCGLIFSSCNLHHHQYKGVEHSDTVEMQLA